MGYGQRIIALLVLVLASACASAGAQRGGVHQNSNIITEEEIRQANATNVYELIQSLRPVWMRTRGTQSLREDPQAEGVGTTGAVVTTNPGRPKIIVYLDNARLGGVEALQQVAAASVASVQYFDAAAATYRWGQGHNHGAILVSSRSSSN